MSKKVHATSVDEFQFLKAEVVKMITKATHEGPISLARAIKRSKKFVRKMKEIKEYHEHMGWPHPEAQFNVDHRDLDIVKPLKQPVVNPDGSLYQKNSITGAGAVSGMTRSVNLDGTPFETPILPGSSLDPKFHSEKKIQAYLEKQAESPSE